MTNLFIRSCCCADERRVFIMIPTSLIPIRTVTISGSELSNQKSVLKNPFQGETINTSVFNGKSVICVMKQTGELLHISFSKRICGEKPSAICDTVSETQNASHPIPSFCYTGRIIIRSRLFSYWCFDSSTYTSSGQAYEIPENG